MEFKTFQTVQKTLEDRMVEGYAAVMGNVDDGGDVIHLGSFAKTLHERASRVKHLWQHDFSQPPIARIVSLDEVKTSELPSDLRGIQGVEGGLRVVREYLTHPLAEAIFQGVKSGAISEMSIGYDPVKYDFANDAESKTRVRHLREIRLWDTSDVNWGMNSATIASKFLPMLDDYKDTLEPELLAALQDLSKIASSVMTPAILQKSGRVLSASNLTRLKDALAVLSEILLAAEPPADDEKSARALTAQILARLAIAQRDPILIA